MHVITILMVVDTGEPELDGEIRLVDKTSPTSGRLEILKDGLWGTVCSYHFGIDDANVACRQMGYSGVAQVHRKLVLVLARVAMCYTISA